MSNKESEFFPQKIQICPKQGTKKTENGPFFAEKCSSRVSSGHLVGFISKKPSICEKLWWGWNQTSPVVRDSKIIW